MPLKSARKTAAFLAFIYLSCAVLRAAQTGAPASKPKSETFSGNIVELLADKLTVSRSILGGRAEKRTFLLNSETKIEGKLHLKAKVTVGYETTGDGDVAHLIVVRQPRKGT